MRQVGDDARPNPFNTIKCEFIGETSEAYQRSHHFDVYTANKVNEKALQYCAKQCWTSDSEECADACTNKFVSAFNMFSREKESFKATLADIELNGGDKYKSRDF